MRKSIVLAGFFASFFLLLSNINHIHAAGNTYYVSITGSDTTGNGTSSNPWKTVTKGVTSMGGGDTLKIAAGTYNESVRITDAKDGTSSQRTLIEAWNTTDVVNITYNTAQSYVMNVESEYTTVRNISFDGLIPPNTAPSTSQTCVRATQGASDPDNLVDVRFDNLKVKNCSGHGIEISGATISGVPYTASGSITNSTVENVSLRNYNSAMSSGWGSGLKVRRGGKDVEIANNIVKNNWGEGIAATRGDNVNIHNNIVFNNYSVNIYVDNSKNITVDKNFTYCTTGAGTILKNGNTASAIAIGEEYYSDTPLWGNQLENVKIINNIAYNCNKAFYKDATYNGTGGLPNGLIANNTFYMVANNSSGISIYKEDQDNLTVRNNIFNLPGPGSVAYSEGSVGTFVFTNNYWVNNRVPSGSSSYMYNAATDKTGTLAQLNFAAAPGFDVNNFKIGASSLAKDAGANLSAIFNYDYDGNSRDSLFDIGAFEYQSGPVTSITANFGASVTSGVEDLVVNFTDSSTAQNTSVTSWAWDFDNNGTTDSTSQNPSYTYLNPGTYTVKLTASNGTISDDEVKTNYITVTATPTVTANFSSNVTSGTVPLNVNFTNTSSATNTTITSWSWDFDNNGTIDSTAQNPSYVYSTVGTYTVKLTVSDGTISDDEIKTNYITVTATPTVTANFSANTTSGVEDLVVTFTDSSTATNTTITSRAWDFDNNGTTDSTVQNPTYTYVNPGTYTVKLTVSNGTISDDEIKIDYITVTADPTPSITANFSANVTSGVEDLTVNFTDTSVAQNTNVAIWAWDFDNNGTTDSTSQNPTFTYVNPGTYTVVLTVSNGLGLSDSETKVGYITVTATPTITANFSANVTNGVEDLAVNFTDTSVAQNTSVTTWDWDFDNNGTTDSTVQNPVFTYVNPGTYTVKLTVSNGTISDEEIKTDYITVTVQTVGSCTLPTYASQDTYARGGNNANRNYGTETIVNTKDGGSNYDRQSFMRFDLTGKTYSEITNAKLKVFVEYIQTGYTAQPTVAFYDVVSNTWQESTLTWNNKPVFGTQLATWNVVDTQEGTWIEVDLTNYVQSEMNGDKIINIGTWDINAANEEVRFKSKESGTPAYIEITGTSTLCN